MNVVVGSYCVGWHVKKIELNNTMLPRFGGTYLPPKRPHTAKMQKPQTDFHCFNNRGGNQTTLVSVLSALKCYSVTVLVLQC